MPVRKIGLCYRSVAGRIPMGSGKENVLTESTLERDFVLLLKFDRGVDEVEQQPVRISYRRSTGELGSYVPDFLVTYRNGSKRLFEVKYSDDPALLSGVLGARMDAARSYAADRGWDFHLITERDIRGPRLANVKFLLPYRSRIIASQTHKTILEAVARRPGLCANELLLRLTKGPAAASEFVSAIWTMIGTGELAVDLNQPLSARIPIQLGS